MKKFLINSLILSVVILFFGLLYLSQIGYETNRFNNLVTEKIKEFDDKISLKPRKIKLKLDIKSFTFYLFTNNPEVRYFNIDIPVTEINAYTKISSIIKPTIKIEKIFVSTNEIKVNVIKQITKNIKPSNIRSIFMNNITSGTLKGKTEFFFDDKFNLKNFQFDGYVKNLNANFLDNKSIQDAKFIFLIEKDKGYLNNFNGKINGISVNNGNLEFSRKDEIKIFSDFVSEIEIDEIKAKQIFKKFIHKNFFDNKIKLNFRTKSELNLTFDKTLKLKNYNINTSGNIDNSFIKLAKTLSSPFTKKELKTIEFKETKMELKLNSKNENFINFSGKYSIDEQKFSNFDIKNDLKATNNFTSLNFDFFEPVEIEIINYKKNKGVRSKVQAAFELKKNFFLIKKLNMIENNNSILIKDLKFNKKNQPISAKKVKIETNNNNFTIRLDDKISIVGRKYDASNLSKIFDGANENKFLNNLNKEVLIELSEIRTSLPKQISGFNLIGKIENGKFVKINSKGEFSNNKFLDISLHLNKDTKKKYLEIFSDEPEPLLNNYKFFKGLTGGKMLLTSNFNENLSESNLSIENFKVKNAPGFVKLLSLADLGGMADLVSGEGLSFEKMEIKFSKDKKILNIEELYAIGPSISILMDGYVESKTGLTSLRGTMVPAKTLNKLISKIPIVGDIVIPKEVGEGLFGVSFKMKGLPGEIKTSVNPIKTLTPRFIQKALNKAK